jgi:hypothetical protein
MVENGPREAVVVNILLSAGGRKMGPPKADRAQGFSRSRRIAKALLPYRPGKASRVFFHQNLLSARKEGWKFRLRWFRPSKPFFIIALGLERIRSSLLLLNSLIVKNVKLCADTLARKTAMI